MSILPHEHLGAPESQSGTSKTSLQPSGQSGLAEPRERPNHGRLSAVAIATRAAALVGGDREREHGGKQDNFERIAGLWNAWLAIRREPDAPLGAHDVGVMMALMKLARTQSGALNVDDYVDACGYSACAGEVACAEKAASIIPD